MLEYTPMRLKAYPDLNITQAMRRTAAKQAGALIYCTPEVLKHREEMIIRSMEYNQKGKVALLAVAACWKYWGLINQMQRKRPQPRAGMMQDYVQALQAFPRADEILDSIESQMPSNI